MKSFKFEISPESILIDDVRTLHHKKYRGLFSGVYVFYDKSGDVLYVGKSKDLSSRMLGHRKSPFYPYIYSVLLYICDNSFDSEVLETLVINDLRPRYNKYKTYYKEESISQLIKDIEYEICSYKDDIRYLTRDIADLKKTDRESFTLDGFSLNSEIEPIKDEIGRLNQLISELKDKKFRLSMKLT